LLPITMRSYRSPKLFLGRRLFGRRLLGRRLRRRRAILDGYVADDGDRPPGRAVSRTAVDGLDGDLLAEQTDFVLGLRNDQADVLDAGRRNRPDTGRTGAAGNPVEQVFPGPE